MNRPVVLPLHGIDLNAEPPFRVGKAGVDPHSRDVTFVGGQERLQPQVLKVLIALARRRGEVVTRDELIAFCWDGRVVGDDVVNRAVLVLRHFAKRAGGFRIETVPKAGYRLVEGDIAAAETKRRWPLLAGTVVAAALLAVGLAWYLNRDRPWDPPVPTIAILPLDHSSADPQAREFAAQVRDELSHKLSEGGFPIRLVGTASDQEVRASGLIISGEVRRQADAFRATVRIEQPAGRIVIYSQQFESAGSDARILPERIGAQVAATLSWTGALMILDPRYQTDPAILADLFKNTTLIVQGDDVLQSYEIARRLAPRAPGSPMAQLSLAFNTGFALEGLPAAQRSAAVNAARQAATQAVALAPEYGDVYATWCFLHSPVRLRECEDRLRYAIRRDPEAPFVAFWLSSWLEEVGRFEESLDFARQSIANDRYKLWKIARLLRALETSGHTAEADRRFDQAMRWWPSHPALIWSRWGGMVAAGNVEEIERFEKKLGEAISPLGRTPPQLLAAIRRGDRASVRKLCEQERRRKPHLCFIGLAVAGDHDGAFAIADDLYPKLKGRSRAEEEALWMKHAGGAPLDLLAARGAASLRKDPRFLAVADRVGLLDYWRGGRLPDFCARSPEPVCASFRPGGNRPAVASNSDQFTKLNLARDQES